jgi:hypothetical protein
MKVLSVALEHSRSGSVSVARSVKDQSPEVEAINIFSDFTAASAWPGNRMYSGLALVAPVFHKMVPVSVHRTDGWCNHR